MRTSSKAQFGRRATAWPPAPVIAPGYQPGLAGIGAGVCLVGWPAVRCGCCPTACSAGSGYESA
jgi:hypothetical protein